MTTLSQLLVTTLPLRHRILFNANTSSTLLNNITTATVRTRFHTYSSRMSATAAAASVDSATTSVVRRGSCLCGQVTFSLSGPPSRNIQCNCINCQKASGSAFLTNILYKKELYKIDTGAEHVKIYEDNDTDSGGKLERRFCGNCGSNLSITNVSNPKMAGNIVIPAGVVDESWKDYVPQSELFPHRRHQFVNAVVKPPSSKKSEGQGGAKI